MVQYQTLSNEAQAEWSNTPTEYVVSSASSSRLLNGGALVKTVRAAIKLPLKAKMTSLAV